MKQKIKNGLQWIGTRCYILYGIIAVLLFFGVNHQRVIFKVLDAFRRAEKDVISQALGKPVLKDFLLWDAVRYYKNILALIPDSPLAQSTVGFCYYHAQDYPQSIGYYEAAVKQDDQYFGLDYNLGVIYFQQEQYARAIDCFQRVLSANPQPTLNYPGLVSPFESELSEENGYREKRLQMLRQTYSWSYRYMVLSYVRQKDYAQVLAQSLLALRNDMFFKDFFYYYVTIASYQLEDYASALKYASLTIKENPEDAGAYHYLGLSFQKMNMDALAQNAFAQEKLLKTRQGSNEEKVQDQERVNPSLFLYVVNAKQEFVKKNKGLPLREK